MGGGKTSTSSSTVSIPPEVLARYNAVNAQAEQVAQTPFQQYSTDPNAFVAPINQTQQSGINQIQSNMGSAQPYYDVATGLTMAGAGPANLGQLNTNQYMSPYLQNVVGTTLAAQQMQNAQQASQLQGQQATQGAFGGDRGNIGLSNLAYQQNLANQQALAGQLQSGYTQAQNTAAQQQGAQLAAQQANLARLSQAGQSIGGLGTAAQNAAITGGQAALTAGTVPQQTQQAGLTALYNQFLQQQGYPFQTTQFLANIAEGTGALSGSTTTNTGPSSFFSDERLKDDVETIGKTFDGQKIVKFRYKGQHGPKQIGLVAQDVEKHHPEAVGEQNGYKTVDYDKATDKAARRGHYYAGGLVANSQGGAVGPEHAGLGFAGGGLVDPMDLQQLVAARAQMYAPYASGGLYGQQNSSTPGAKGVVPSGNLPTPKLVTASTPSTQQAPVGKQIMSDIGDLKEGVSDFNWAKQGLMGTPAQSYTKDGSTYTTPAQPGLISQAKSWLDSSQQQPSGNARGGVIGRHHYDDGGEVDDNKDHAIPYGGDSIVGEVAKEGEKSPQMLKAAQTAQAGGQGSTVGNLLGAASTLKGLYGLGSDVAGGLGNLAGGFNAATNAGTLDSVLGSGFTAENIGLGAGGASAAGTGLMGSIGSGLGSIFSALPFLKDGGVVPRQHKDKGGTSDDTGQSEDQTSQQDLTPSNAQAHLSYLTGQGVDPIVAAGMLGNAGRESHLNATVPGDNGDSFGLYQFNKNGELPAFQKFAKDNNLDVNDPKTQHQFVINQLNGPYSDVRDAMIKSGDPAQAAKIFMQGYERPAAETAGLDDRMSYANLIANGGNPKFGAMKVASNVGSQSQPSGIMGDIGSAADSVGNWYDRNQNWLVPLATGLGTMAASPSRYLGAAILQGIGGAAQASQRQQLQQSQIAKNTMGMFADRFTPVPGGMFDKSLNQVIPIDQFRSQYANVLNQITGFNKGNIPSQATAKPATTLETPKELQGPQAPAAPQSQQQAARTTASTQAAPSANAPAANAPQDPLASYTIPNIVDLNIKSRNDVLDSFKNQTMDLNNPLFLLQESKRLQDDADSFKFTNPNYSISQQTKAMQYLTDAKKIISDYTSDVNKTNADVTKDRQNQSVAAKQSVQNDADQASARKQVAMQMRDTLFDVKGNPILTTGPWSQQKADFAMKLNQLGVPTSVTDKYIINAANYTELQKNVAPLALQGTRAALSTKDPIKVTEFNKMFEKGTPNPETMPAEAIKFLIDKSIVPQADLAMRRNDYIANIDPMKYDVNGVRTKFDKENQFYTSNQEQAQKELQRRAAAAELDRRAKANSGVQ